MKKTKTNGGKMKKIILILMAIMAIAGCSKVTEPEANVIIRDYDMKLRMEHNANPYNEEDLGIWIYSDFLLRNDSNMKSENLEMEFIVFTKENTELNKVKIQSSSFTMLYAYEEDRATFRGLILSMEAFGDAFGGWNSTDDISEYIDIEYNLTWD